MEEYGKNEKRISFMDTDKRSAEMIIRLKHDGLTKTKFFRAILTGYLERDAAIVEFIEGLKKKVDLKANLNQKRLNSWSLTVKKDYLSLD